jgi:hypothetical protein
MPLVQLVSVKTDNFPSSTHRNYSLTARRENALVIGGIGILAVAAGLQIGLKAYNSYQSQKGSADSTPETPIDKSEDIMASKNQERKSKSETSKSDTNSASESNTGFFTSFFATTFYDGGFGKTHLIYPPSLMPLQKIR